MSDLTDTRRALAMVETLAEIEASGGCTARHLEDVVGPPCIAAIVDLLWAGRVAGQQLPLGVGWGYVALPAPAEGERRRGMRWHPRRSVDSATPGG